MHYVRTSALTIGLVLATSAITVGCGKKEAGDKADEADKADKKEAGEKAAAAGETKAKPEGEATPTYTVKLERPVPVGHRYHIESTGMSTTRVLADGKPIPGQAKRFAWIYEADVIVKAVTARGQPSAEEHTVAKLVVDFPDEKVPPANLSGVVVATVVDGEETFTVDGMQVHEELQDVLQAITHLDDGTSFDNDAVFGSTTPRKVGESWDMNKQALVDGWGRKFEGSKLPAKTENVSGKITLVESKTVDSVDGLVFETQATVNDATPELGAINPTSGTIAITETSWIPSDPKSVAGTQRIKTLVMHAEGELVQQGQTIKIVMDASMEGNETITAIE
jgi:hypothetical protein